MDCSPPWDFLGKNMRVGGYDPLPGDLHDLGTESMSVTSPALAGEFFALAPPGKPKETSNLRNIN